MYVKGKVLQDSTLLLIVIRIRIERRSSNSEGGLVRLRARIMVRIKIRVFEKLKLGN